jgi:beta-lactamase class A
MDYIMLMMTVSDNTATDYLVGLVGQKSIQEKVLLPFGLTGSKCDMDCAGLLTNYYGVNIDQYRAKCGTGKWFDCYKNSYFRCTEEKNNQTTPRDMVKLLSLLNAGQVVDAGSDRQMLNIMAQCKTNARIPAKLPDDVVVEHKT